MRKEYETTLIIDDVANARMVVECTGSHKVQYTWYA